MKYILKGVEEEAVLNDISCFREPLGQEEGPVMDLPGDLGDTVGPVVDAVHGRDVGQQRLSCANVARRLVPV